MPLPFLALAPNYPRPVDISYEAATLPCTDTFTPCSDCTLFDPFEQQPPWENLDAPTMMTAIPIYGTLGFDQYAYE